jgi:hypothetical protein
MRNEWNLENALNITTQFFGAAGFFHLYNLTVSHPFSVTSESVSQLASSCPKVEVMGWMSLCGDRIATYQLAQRARWNNI